MKCEINKIHPEKIEEVKNDNTSIEELSHLSNLFKTLGDLTRVRILFVLNNRQMCVCDIALSLEMTQSAVSHQLKILRLNNLVKYQKVGKEVFYSLSDDHVKYLFTIGLDHVRE